MENDRCTPDCSECIQAEKANESLRALLAEPSPFTDVEYPVTLTVYTAHGTVTVENIAESSIRFADGTLTCEAQYGWSKCPLYTFGSVQGYSSTFA